MNGVSGYRNQERKMGNGKKVKINVTLENPKPNGQLRCIYPVALAKSDAFLSIPERTFTHSVKAEALHVRKRNTLIS